MKTIKKINSRYFGATLLILVATPVFFMASWPTIATRSIACGVFTIAAIYAVWEFVKHMEIHTATKILLPLSVVPIMLIDQEFTTINVVIKHTEITNLHRLVLNAIPLYYFIYAAIIATIVLIDPFARNAISPYTTFLYAIVAVVLPGLFFKSMFIFSATNPLWLAIIIPTAIISDTFAYFGGLLGHKKFSKKLAPNISPKKTWVGFWSGYISTVVYLIIILTLSKLGIIPIKMVFSNMKNFDIVFMILIILLLPLMSPIGDLTYSWFKRERGIKDYSNLIPGHGGLLDRIDSWIWINFLFLVLYQILG